MAKSTTSSPEATRKIEVFYKTMTTKTGTKFKKWLTVTKDGKFYQVKFIMNALTNLPTARSTITVNDSDMYWNKKNPQYPLHCRISGNNGIRQPLPLPPYDCASAHKTSHARRNEAHPS